MKLFRRLFNHKRDMDILNTIHSQRIRQDLTQAEIARRCGITQQYYSNIERGKISPSIKLAQKILNELGYKIVPK